MVQPDCFFYETVHKLPASPDCSLATYGSQWSDEFWSALMRAHIHISARSHCEGGHRMRAAAI